MTPADSDRDALSAVAIQLANCAEAARTVAVNTLRSRKISSALACEIGTLQLSLQLQVTEVRRILSQWPK